MPGRYDGRVTSPRFPVWFALALLCASVLGACDSAASSATTDATARPTAAPSVRPSIAGPKPSTGTTQTGWGTIWDTLPKGFPTPPGSTPAEETATGPASANLVVEGSDAKGIASGVQQALGAAGYRTKGLQGPLEDGSYVLEMTGPSSDCQVQVSAAPTGGLTTVTILYGVGCPHD
jgi:hypothetical protein